MTCALASRFRLRYSIFDDGKPWVVKITQTDVNVSTVGRNWSNFNKHHLNTFQMLKNTK